MDVAVIGGSAWFVGALESVLRANGRYRLAASVEVGRDVAKHLGAVLGVDEPAIVIVACETTDEEVVALTRALKARREGKPPRDLRTVVKLHSLRAHLVRDVMQAGAWGCFWAGDPPETVLAALGAVAQGRMSFPFVDFSEIGDDPFEQLTARERDVLKALAQGWSNLQISARLGISENTVKHYLKLVYGKLGVTNRAAAVARWLERVGAGGG